MRAARGLCGEQPGRQWHASPMHSTTWARRVDPRLEVATLDVTKFSNASDDACSILTNALEGIPCCWITHDWDRQSDDPQKERWDLPPTERMAPTQALALDRVVAWRRAGGFEIASGGGVSVRSWRWEESGLSSCETPVSGALVTKGPLATAIVSSSVVVFGGPRVRRVRWPHPERIDSTHEAIRRGARPRCTWAMW